MQKLLSAHEASYLQSLRNLKKKINLLQSNAGKQTARAINSKQKQIVECWFLSVVDCWRICHFFPPCTFPTGTCPKLEAPINGRKLGKSHSMGHEVHFLCEPGYELVGSESRVCQESLTWSGQQTACRGEHQSPVLWFCCDGHILHWLILFPAASLLFITLSDYPVTLLSNHLITLQPCHHPLCNSSLSCSHPFLSILHDTVFQCGDTFNIWPGIKFPYCVHWSLSRELSNVQYSNVCVLLSDLPVIIKH